MPTAPRSRTHRVRADADVPADPIQDFPSAELPTLGLRLKRSAAA
jgi:hypothetical protein